MEQVTIDSIDNFKLKTTYDLNSFFENYVDFIDNDYGNIINFYTGTSDVYPTQSFKVLKSLLEEGKKIIDVFINNINNLPTYDYWILLENIEDMIATLMTADNSSRWCRSSIVSTKGYLQNVQVQYVGKQGQGLEQIEKDVIGSNDPEETWVDTALNNDLREEDYTIDGNYLIKIVYSNGKSVAIQSVVDNIDTAEKTYGLDVKRVLEFDDNDLVVLGYNDTLLQSAEILAGLKQGDNPVIPDLGIDPRFIGSNVAAFSYPTLFRQVAQSFASDDCFEAFAIIDVDRDQDSIQLRFQVKPKAGKFIDQVVSI